MAEGKTKLTTNSKRTTKTELLDYRDEKDQTTTKTVLNNLTPTITIH